MAPYFYAVARWVARFNQWPLPFFFFLGGLLSVSSAFCRPISFWQRAYEDYTAIYEQDPNHVAWYQRECAMYHHSVVDAPVVGFNMDVDLDKYFKARPLWLLARVSV